MVLRTVRKYQGLDRQLAGTAKDANVAAPHGGLNTRDAESAMLSTDALIMENWFPGQGSISTRKGFTQYTTGLTGDVETLAEFNAGTNRKFICANSDEINDVTNPLSISNLGSSFSNARWQTVNFNANLLLFNGADTPQIYNGSTLTNSTINGSGLTPSTLTGVNVHKNRVYTWDDDEQDFWYGATNAIQGTFTKFQLSRVAPFGGNLISMMTWNHDGGDGVDDFALFHMSSGDVILYNGSNPGDANDWALIGIYKIGSPIAIRGAAKVAGDVAIITNQDFIFVSQVFQSGGAKLLETKLSGAAIQEVNNFGSNYGWEVALYPRGSAGGWLIFNVPRATGETYVQYIINTITGAACKFTGMNARTWGTFDDKLYFGESGKIMQADDGLDDNGNFIECDTQAAYHDFESPAEKVLNAFKNTIKVDGNVDLNTLVNFDYKTKLASQTSSATSAGTAWDSVQWDSSFWSPENQTQSNYVISSGQGVALGMRIKVSLKGQQLFWFRTDYSLNLIKNI